MVRRGLRVAGAPALHPAARARRVLKLGALILGSLAAVPGSAPLFAQESEILGVVRDSLTGEPVAEARVTVSGHGPDALTDTQGQFRVVVTGTDPVRLTVERLGYVTGSLEITPQGASTRVEIRLEPVQFALEELRVEASAAREGALVRAPAATTRIRSEELRRIRGQTLGHTIEEIPGVSIIQYGPSIAKPVVRGLHSQRIVVNNSGVRQEGQQWGGEHAPEIDIFSAQEIEVVRGPGGVVYGPDALGGVVRIEPGYLTDETGWHGEVLANAFANNRQGAGSFMLENGGLRLPLLGRTSTRLRVSTRKAGDAASPDYNLRNTGFGELNVSGGFGWSGDWGSSEVLLSRYDSELGLYTGAHFGNFDDLQRAMERGPVAGDFSYQIDSPRQEITHDMALWRNRFLLGEGQVMEARYAFQLNRRREFDKHGPTANSGVPAFGLDLYTHTLDGSYAFESRAGTTTLGLTGMRQGNISVGGGYLIPQYRLYQGGGFVKQDVERGPVTLSAAARYDYFWQRVFPVPGRLILDEIDTRVFDDVAGSVGLTWEFARGWFLGGSAGRAWRAPNVNERYSEGVHHGTAQYEIGDAALGPEQTFNVDATLRKAGSGFTFQLNAYRNAIDGYIFLRPRDPVLTIRGAYPAYNYEATDAVITGLELDFDITVWRGLHVFAHGNLTRGDDRIGNEPLFDMPADRIRVGGRYLATGGGWWSGLFAEVSGLLVREQDQVPAVTIYALPTAAYETLDMSVGVDRLQIGGTPLEVALEVSNLLDRSYRDYLSRYKLFVDDPGRDIVLRVRAPLNF